MSEYSRENLAARLLEFESYEQLKEQYAAQLTYHDLFEVVQVENTMSTLGIRLLLFEKKEENNGGGVLDI